MSEPIEPGRRPARRRVAFAAMLIPAIVVAVLVSLAHKPPVTADQAAAGALADKTQGGNVSANPRRSGDSAQVVTVYKSPTCTCCTAWVDHVRRSGFTVIAIDTTDLDAVKRRHGVAPEHAACHTAIVGGYVVEGHAPASDIRRLLAERPAIRGLAVPGMPMGSPGMEGAYEQTYDVLAFSRGSPPRIFATH